MIYQADKCEQKLKIKIMNSNDLVMTDQNIVAIDKGLLARPANQLLNDFGAGKAAPGSGSAAALLSLLSAKMLHTVCDISTAKPECAGSTNEFRYIVDTIKDEIEPRLKELFELDARDFEKVVSLRRARDAATDPLEKNRYSREALSLLETATDYTFEVGEISLRLMGFGVAMFEAGWHAVRGDSGVALSAAMSGVMSSIFIANLNLKTLKRRNYAKNNIGKCQELQTKLNDLQTKAFSCVTQISSESLESIQLELETE